MKRLLLPIFTILTVVLVLVFLEFGGWKMIDLAIKVTQAKSEFRSSIWNVYIPKGVVRNGTTNFNAFWISHANNQIRVWTVEGIKTYRLTKDTTFYFNDVCSTSSVQSRIKYANPNSVSSQISLEKWDELIKRGDVVSLTIYTKDSTLQSMYLSNSNFYQVWTGKPMDLWCK